MVACLSDLEKSWLWRVLSGSQIVPCTETIDIASLFSTIKFSGKETYNGCLSICIHACAQMHNICTRVCMHACMYVPVHVCMYLCM